MASECLLNLDVGGVNYVRISMYLKETEIISITLLLKTRTPHCVPLVDNGFRVQCSRLKRRLRETRRNEDPAATARWHHRQPHVPLSSTRDHGPLPLPVQLFFMRRHNAMAYARNTACTGGGVLAVYCFHYPHAVP